MNFKKAIIILFLVTVVSFAPAISADFVNWDDDAHILKNPLVQQFTLAKIPEIFLKADSANHTYQPLTTISWGLEYWLFGKNPLVFHLSNLALHLAVVLVVFLLAGQFGLGIWGAFACALIFAVHPTRVENVAWITARKDLLYGLFYLLSIWAYVRYLDKQDKLNYGLALLFGVLSIFSKAMALSLPWVLFLIDWMRRRKYTPTMIIDKLPFIFMILPLAWVTYTQNSRGITLDFATGFLVWFWSAAFYIQKFIWPGGLSPVYGMPEPVELVNPVYWFTVIVLVVTAVVLWRGAKNRWLVFAFAFYFLTSFFLWRFDWRDISVVADRFLYVPAFGACLGLGRLFEYAWNKGEKFRRPAVLVLVGLALVLGTSTFVYAFAWRDGFSLWSRVAEYSPDLAFAYNNRGSFYLGKDDKVAAMRDFKKAMEIAGRRRVNKEGKNMLPAKSASQYAASYYNMGLLYAKEKNYEEALKDFNLAIYYELEKAEYYNNRGVTLMKLGKKEEALADYNTALSLNPDFYEVRINRGLYLYKTGKKKEALEDFLKATQIDTTLPEAYMQAGRIDFEEGQTKEAQEMFLGALKADEDNAQALYNLGLLQAKMGNKEKAQSYFSQAQVKWTKDPEKYPLPGLNPKDAKIWTDRLGKK